MEDSRGVLRGACNFTQCHCLGYTPLESSMKCSNCGHPPGKHTKLQEPSTAPLDSGKGTSIISYPFVDNSDSDQEDDQDGVGISSSRSTPSLPLLTRIPVAGRGRGRVKCSRESPKPIKRLSQYSPVVPLQSNSATGIPRPPQTPELSDNSTGSLQVSDSNGTDFEENRSQTIDADKDENMPFSLAKHLGSWIFGVGEQEIPEELLCIGCRKRKKHKQEDDSYYDYCGKTCSNLYHRNSKVLLPGQPSCRKCGRPCTYQRKDGTYHDYCGITCRDAHQLVLPKMSIDGTSASISICHQGEAKARSRFQNMWAQLKGPCPSVEHVFTITNTILQSQFNSYSQGKGQTVIEEHFHGTSITCDLARTQTLCSDAKCGVCNISRVGFDSNLIGTNVSFQRFGQGFYLAPNSSKCHDYTQGCQVSGHRALLLCEVCPGRKHTLYKDNTRLKGPPIGYDCVYGNVGQDLNYPEIVMYKSHSILPKYILLYKLNGTHKLV